MTVTPLDTGGLKTLDTRRLGPIRKGHLQIVELDGAKLQLLIDLLEAEGVGVAQWRWRFRLAGGNRPGSEE